MPPIRQPARVGANSKSAIPATAAGMPTIIPPTKRSVSPIVHAPANRDSTAWAAYQSINVGTAMNIVALSRVLAVCPTSWRSAASARLSAASKGGRQLQRHVSRRSEDVRDPASCPPVARQSARYPSLVARQPGPRLGDRASKVPEQLLNEGDIECARRQPERVPLPPERREDRQTGDIGSPTCSGRDRRHCESRPHDALRPGLGDTCLSLRRSARDYSEHWPASHGAAKAVLNRRGR